MIIIELAVKKKKKTNVNIVDEQTCQNFSGTYCWIPILLL